MELAHDNEITLIEQEKPPAQPEYPVAESSPAAMMMAAMRQGASLEQVEKMMALQERWEAGEARKVYNAAFAAFKAEAVRILKNRAVNDGPLKGKTYAELHSVVDAVTPALSKHGLGASWRLTKDEKDWIEVTCTLKHSSGHSESVSMGGPPDAGGAKNAIQARASTISYLERYTLKAICGVAEGGDDDDGAGGANRAADWLAAVDGASTEDELLKVKTEGSAAFTKAKDVPGYSAFMKAVGIRHKAIKDKGTP